MVVKTYRKLPKYIVRQLYDLVWAHNECVDDCELIYCFFDEIGDFVGAIFLKYEDFILQGKPLPKPMFNIYIEKFEVNPKRRREGWGKAMYEWLVNHIPIRTIGLCHVIEEKDGGASYRWWRHMGFHKPQALYSYMEKHIN